MASMRDIKRRRESIESTEQITKAMKLVSTVKLQKARQKAESARPYTNVLYDTVCEILRKTEGTSHPYLEERTEGKTAVILVSGNRGLCGGYNQNIIKKVTELPDPKENLWIYAFGKKGIEGLRGKGYVIRKDLSEVVNEPLYKDAIAISEELLKEFKEGKIARIYLAYTEFKNTVVHTPKLIQLLPVRHEETEKDGRDTNALPMNFEPNDETVLDSLVPQYMTSLIYGALLQSVASENGARMTAMDAATDNAEEMIGKLALQYNRARQGSITQELTEIIAGRNAVQ